MFQPCKRATRWPPRAKDAYSYNGSATSFSRCVVAVAEEVPVRVLYFVTLRRTVTKDRMDSFHLHNRHLCSFISMLLIWSIFRCLTAASYDKSSCGSSARPRPTKDRCLRKSCETKLWVSLNNKFSICGIADLLIIRTVKKSKWDKPVRLLNSVWNLRKKWLSLRRNWRQFEQRGLWGLERDEKQTVAILLVKLHTPKHFETGYLYITN